MIRKALSRLSVPQDIAALAVFRIIIGTIVCVSLIRFQLESWIEPVFVEPGFFFKYPGFEWVQVWSKPYLHLLFSFGAFCAFCVALGFYYRIAIALLFLSFTYIQLMDVTNYLNHYYLVVLLLGLMNFMPLHRLWSIDAWRKPEMRQETVPSWVLYLLRFQIAIVYVNAGLAKIEPDWLLHAQPMNIWMTSLVHLPVIGGILDSLQLAYFMSWAGCFYDLTIVGFLLYRPTRIPAYLTVIIFHLLTLVFFDIGMFPFIMIGCTTLFFSPSWPRRFMAQSRAFMPLESQANSPVQRPLVFALALYCAIQVLVPLRSHLSEHSVLWGEQGMRYSWRVMLREKSGSITYHVRSKENGRTWLVSPHDYLTWRQVSEMSGQPDMILQLGKYISGEFDKKGLGPVEVRVEAWVSLNGRKPHLLIDPEVDLLNIKEELTSASWILAQPEEPPIQLKKTFRAKGP